MLSFFSHTWRAVGFANLANYKFMFYLQSFSGASFRYNPSSSFPNLERHPSSGCTRPNPRTLLSQTCNLAHAVEHPVAPGDQCSRELNKNQIPMLIMPYWLTMLHER